MRIIDDYRKDIKKCIENEINKNESLLKSFILNPTPSKIKRECLQLLENKKANIDQAILKNFFKYEDDSNKQRVIDQYKSDKLKPICRFISGKTSDMQSDEAINLVALLIDFQPRPYAKYRLEENNPEFTEENVRTDILSKERPENTDAKESENLEGKDFNGSLKILLAIILTGLSILLTYNLFSGNSNECITWQKDHFEKVECTGGELEVPYNKDLLEKFKKIKVCDTTTFFKNGKPIVFYLKYKNKLEFFSWYGEHPVYKGKFLDPITAHIIETHVKPCDNVE